MTDEQVKTEDTTVDAKAEAAKTEEAKLNNLVYAKAKQLLPKMIEEALAKKQETQKSVAEETSDEAAPKGKKSARDLEFEALKKQNEEVISMLKAEKAEKRNMTLKTRLQAIAKDKVPEGALGELVLEKFVSSQVKFDEANEALVEIDGDRKTLAEGLDIWLKREENKGFRAAPITPVAGKTAYTQAQNNKVVDFKPAADPFIQLAQKMHDAGATATPLSTRK